jgi:hypothetical protein
LDGWWQLLKNIEVELGQFSCGLAHFLLVNNSSLSVHYHYSDHPLSFQWYLQEKIVYSRGVCEVLLTAFNFLMNVLNIPEQGNCAFRSSEMVDKLNML